MHRLLNSAIASNVRTCRCSHRTRYDLEFLILGGQIRIRELGKGKIDFSEEAEPFALNLTFHFTPHAMPPSGSFRIDFISHRTTTYFTTASV
jgi:hypothetical protein